MEKMLDAWHIICFSDKTKYDKIIKKINLAFLADNFLIIKLISALYFLWWQTSWEKSNEKNVFQSLRVFSIFDKDYIIESLAYI